MKAAVSVWPVLCVVFALLGGCAVERGLVRADQELALMQSGSSRPSKGSAGKASSATAEPQVLRPIQGTRPSAREAGEPAPVTTAAPEAAETTLSMAGTARDTRSYRTGTALAIAVDLSRSRPASSIRSDADIVSLARSLVAASEDPFLQVKAIHDWIALVLRYDAQAYFSGDTPSQSWQSVLRSGKAVCEGYSNVTSRMLSAAGFTEQKVHGYARGASSDVLRDDAVQQSNHAWNMVKIAGLWYLLDTTWDSGYLDGRTATSEYSTEWFLIAPQAMIYSHFPDNPAQQLLSTPLSAAEFSKLPHLDGSFFDVLTDGWQQLAKRMNISGPSSFDFSIAEGYRLEVVLYDDDGRQQDYAFAQQEGSRATVYVAPPAGTWLLRFFATDPQTSHGISMGELTLSADGRGAARAPSLYQLFDEIEARLISPLMKPVKVGQRITLSLYIATAQEVFASAGSERIPLNSMGDNIWTAELTVPRTQTLDIFIKTEASSTRSRGLLSIPVQP